VFSLVALVASLAVLLLAQRVRWFVVSVRLLQRHRGGMLVLLRGFTIAGGRVLFGPSRGWEGRLHSAGRRRRGARGPGIARRRQSDRCWSATPLPKLLAPALVRVPALLIESAC
jgi:hypothetical protein